MSGTVPNEAPLQHTPSSLSLLDEQILSQEPSSLAQQHPSVCVWSWAHPSPLIAVMGGEHLKGRDLGMMFLMGLGGISF